MDGIKDNDCMEAKTQQDIIQLKSLNVEDVKGFEIHNPVSFENLTGKLWAKAVRNFGTVELSMKADSIEFQLIK